LSNYEVPRFKNETAIGSSGPTDRRLAASTLHNVMRVVARRRVWVLVPFVICLLLAVIATLLMNPTYESTATIELNKSGTGIDLGIGDDLSSSLGGGGESLLTDLQTETAILKDNSLALAVIQRLKLAARPPFAVKPNETGNAIPNSDSQQSQTPKARTRLLAIFHRHLKVLPNHGTRLIQVSFESHDQEQAAEVANALIDAYKSHYLQSHYEATTETSSWLTAQLSDLKNNVEDSQKKLVAFEKANGILSVSVGGDPSDDSGGGGSHGRAEIHSPVIQKLDALTIELTQAEANRIGKEAIYRLAQSGNADVVLGLQTLPLASLSGALSGGGLSNLQALRLQQSQFKLQLAQESTSFGKNNRHLRELEVQLQSLDNQVRQELKQITKQAQVDFELARRTESGIRQQFNDQQVAASKLNETAIQLALLSEEAFSHKRLYEDLYTKLQQANVSAGIQATNITVVDPARPQSEAIRPKPLQYVALGGLLGLFVGLTAAYTADNFDRTVSTPDEVEEITGKPVIGVIPELRRARKTDLPPLLKGGNEQEEEQGSASSPIWMVSHPNSSAGEAFRTLRTSIMLSSAGGSPKVILVTSCIPEEGKTTVTTNLAAAFAQQHGKKVLIVEADMRRPRMERVLGFPTNRGLSNVLTGSATCEEAIVHIEHVASLDLLPAGPAPPNSSELLGSTAFDELLHYLRSKYDVVFVDSPPALLTTDPVLISTKVDAVIWVSRVGIVERSQLARAARLIERSRMPVIGFVVNRMSSRLAGYGYGYGYEDYGSYYGKQDTNES
jgi:polysaccharide biosynthesis transport protein